MISMKHIQKNESNTLTPLKSLDQKWLINQPWLWETRIHHVLVYTLLVNITVIIGSLIIGNSWIIYMTGIVLSLVGFGVWIYKLWQFSIEQDRGKTGDFVAQKRFGIYFLSMCLFIFPCIAPSFVESRGTTDTIILALSVACPAAVGAMLIQIWKQIHTKLFIYTLVWNALFITGTMVLINLSSFFIVLLVAAIIFSFPMLISLVTDVPKIKKFNSWKVIALASIQFYAPFLLSFVIGIFMIPFSQLFSGFVFVVGLFIAAFSYIAYVLPTFRQMHIHMQSLPR